MAAAGGCEQHFGIVREVADVLHCWLQLHKKTQYGTYCWNHGIAAIMISTLRNLLVSALTPQLAVKIYASTEIFERFCDECKLTWHPAAQYHSTAQHSSHITAQHTAQSSTAPPNTAYCSPAEGSTALHSTTQQAEAPYCEALYSATQHTTLQNFASPHRRPPAATPRIG